MRIWLSAVLTAMITFAAGKAMAQAPYPSCFSINNVQVQYFPDPTINDIAIARLAPNGMPVVLWNPGILLSMQPATQEFFYYHECAHHALGHTLGAYGPGSERQADCWAKQTMDQVGVLTQHKYQIIRQQLIQFSSPGIDWPNGQVRVAYLDQC